MKRVLVVDDSAFMRAAIKRILTKNGYTVVGEASNGRDGIEKYKELFPDIVSLDITMNEMNGLEALAKILEFNPGACVFMVSAMGQHSIVEEAAKAGAKGFLVKPFNEKTVLAQFDKIICG